MITPEIVKGDLLDQEVEVIANAWNRNLIPWWLLLPQGVSAAIKRRGGVAPFREVAKAGIMPLGGAVLTGAGKLPFKGIIHVAGINLGWFATKYSVRQSVRSAMEIVNREGFRSVAFPLIGSGSGNWSCVWALGLMLDEFQKLSSTARVVIVRYMPSQIRLNPKRQVIEYREDRKGMDVPAHIHGGRGFHSIILPSRNESIGRWKAPHDRETVSDDDKKRIFSNIVNFCETHCAGLEIVEKATCCGTRVEIREYGRDTTANAVKLLAGCEGLTGVGNIIFQGHIASADLNSPEIPAIRKQIQARDWQGIAGRPAAGSLDCVNWNCLLRADGRAAIAEMASRDEMWCDDTIVLPELSPEETGWLLPHIEYWTRLKPGAELPDGHCCI